MGPELPSQARGQLLPWNGLSAPHGAPPDAAPASLGFVQTRELPSGQEAPLPAVLPRRPISRKQLLPLPSSCFCPPAWPCSTRSPPPIPTLAPTGSHGKEDPPGNQTPPRLPHQRFMSCLHLSLPTARSIFEDAGGPFPETPQGVAALRGCPPGPWLGICQVARECPQVHASPQHAGLFLCQGTGTFPSFIVLAGVP